jgi:hypothetical protein
MSKLDGGREAALRLTLRSYAARDSLDFAFLLENNDGKAPKTSHFRASVFGDAPQGIAEGHASIRNSTENTICFVEEVPNSC